MPTNRVSLSIAQPSHLVSEYDMRLAAKKTISPAATDAHGTIVESIVAVSPTRTDCIVTVVS
jgi:hypothetical protein